VKVLLAGGSGFLGTALRVRFAAQGTEVRRLVRSTPLSSNEFYWNPSEGKINNTAFDGIDVLINFAGAPVFSRPWTAARKQLLRSSRLDSTRLLAQTMATRFGEAARRPLWLQASAAGWYGTESGAEPYEESAPPADDFLGGLARDWEAATQPAADAGIVVYRMRNGIVLDDSGSVLRLIKPVFRLGFGAVLGTGRQHMAMISLHDWRRAAEFLITTQPPAGAYNLVLPTAPTNAEFSRELARQLGSKIRLGAPQMVIRKMLGELSGQLLGDQWVAPRALSDQGFEFHGADVAGALRLALT
jgi:uncharacterized protein (TIGR01777 family)